jgi:hypothetical protein
VSLTSLAVALATDEQRAQAVEVYDPKTGCWVPVPPLAI